MRGVVPFDSNSSKRRTWAVSLPPSNEHKSIIIGVIVKGMKSELQLKPHGINPPNHMRSTTKTLMVSVDVSKSNILSIVC